MTSPRAGHHFLLGLAPPTPFFPHPHGGPNPQCKSSDQIRRGGGRIPPLARPALHQNNSNNNKPFAKFPPCNPEDCQRNKHGSCTRHVWTAPPRLNKFGKVRLAAGGGQNRVKHVRMALLLFRAHPPTHSPHRLGLMGVAVGETEGPGAFPGRKTPPPSIFGVQGANCDPGFR